MFVEVIYLPANFVAHDIQGSEVVLAVGVVVDGEIVKVDSGSDHCWHIGLAQPANPMGDEKLTALALHSQLVVQRPDLGDTFVLLALVKALLFMGIHGPRSYYSADDGSVLSLK